VPVTLGRVTSAIVRPGLRDSRPSMNRLGGGRRFEFSTTWRPDSDSIPATTRDAERGCRVGEGAGSRRRVLVVGGSVAGGVVGWRGKAGG
jgi:hypothetical protein